MGGHQGRVGVHHQQFEVGVGAGRPGVGAGMSPGGAQPGQPIGILGRPRHHPPGGRGRGDLAEPLGLVPQGGQVRKAVAAVGPHHRQIPQHRRVRMTAPGACGTPARQPRFPHWRRPLRLQLGLGAGRHPPGPAQARPERAGAVDTAGPAPRVEPSQALRRPLVDRELQGGLQQRPGRARQSPQELDRLKERPPQGPPDGLPPPQGQRRARVACRFTTGAIRVLPDRKHVQLPRIGVLKRMSRQGSWRGGWSRAPPASSPPPSAAKPTAGLCRSPSRSSEHSRPATASRASPGWM